MLPTTCTQQQHHCCWLGTLGISPCVVSVRALVVWKEPKQQQQPLVLFDINRCRSSIDVCCLGTSHAPARIVDRKGRQRCCLPCQFPCLATGLQALVQFTNLAVSVPQIVPCFDSG
jgi:hypothetical protein